LIFKETPLAGAFVIEPERIEDERGFFATEFAVEEFGARGLDPRVAQTAVSFNKLRGTLRGMHYQADPHGQAKLIRCLNGSVYDVIIDLRRHSPFFKRWHAINLTSQSMVSLYVPPGFAHGFETLEDASVVSYLLSTPRHPPSERGVRWNEPSVGIEWPFTPTVISPRDSSLPGLSEEQDR
jgi:dTDP-4-dehydrorhamnose 3,5-epimerase